MKKRYWNFLRLIIGVGILLLLFYKVGIARIVGLLAEFNFKYILPIMMSLVLIFLLEALNLKILLGGIKSVSYLRVLKYHLLSWSVGLFVPGKIGQFSIVYLLKKEGIGMGSGGAVVLVDKLVTLLTLSILTLCGFFIFFSLELALVMLFVLVAGALLIMAALHGKSRSLVKRFILRKHSVKFKGFSKMLKSYIKEGDGRKRLLLNFLLTFFKWGVSATMIFFLFLSFNHFVDYSKILLITPMGVLISFVPVSLSGLGIRESTVAFLYSQIGVSAIAVVSVYLVNLVINYLVALCGAMLFLGEFKKK